MEDVFEDAGGDALPDDFQTMSADDLKRRSRLLDNEIRVLRDESTRLGLEHSGLKERIKDNKEKIKLSNQLPYLVGNVVEILDVSPDDEEVCLRQTTMLASVNAAAGAGCVGAGMLAAAPSASRWMCSSQATLHPTCAGGRRGGGPGQPAPGQVRGAEDQHAADDLPAGGGPGGRHQAEAGGPGGRQQGQLPHPGHAARGVRLPRQGHGGALRISGFVNAAVYSRGAMCAACAAWPCKLCCCRRTVHMLWMHPPS
jgi:hypothetical protein